MTVKSVDRDPKALTMTIVSEFEAPIDKVWQLWENPRLLERWWGPPTYPATFVEHDLRAGGSSKYFMTGPEGDKSRGWWRVLAAEAPNSLELEDGFADDSGNPNPDMPTTRMRMDLSESNGVTRMTIVGTFPSLEEMEKLVSMGMEEGMKEALGQIDEILRAEVNA
jgi:uncharacterized protein YndB with AHSA1/START domain